MRTWSEAVSISRRFDDQRAKLSAAMTKGKFEALLAETLAQVRCGHTSMKFDLEMEMVMKNAHTLPLRVLIEGARLMVLFDDTADDRAIRPGMKILEINGQTRTDLLGRFLMMAPADGDIQTGKRRSVAR